LHRYHLVFLYLKNKHKVLLPKAKFTTLPKVTVQLPVYNEMYVVERLVNAACRINYPKELLEIQVLDDSTDGTTQISEAVVEQKQKEGFNISLIHRTNRHGFKAGALENGLKLASGEFIAIFDADFIPATNFLEDVINYFSDNEVGMIQVRWGHINREYSLLTQIESVILDGHFIIEHGGRHLSGRFFNFNGTAGIWRRQAIETAGGWQHDTLTEDTDLSYRAQMAGWKFVYLPHIVCPAELPVEMNAFKTQQARWGQRTRSNGHQVIAPDFEERPAAQIEDRSVLPFVREYFVSADDCPFVFAAARHDCSFQSGVVPNALYRPSAVAFSYCFGVDVLSRVTT
jgi:cellulose synthase/poly-beta-1,6-N-acetylglucosamine synthase-like glycosyltransferase